MSAGKSSSTAQPSTAQPLPALVNVHGDRLGAALPLRAQPAALTPAHLAQHDTPPVVGRNRPRQRCSICAHGPVQLLLERWCGLATRHAASQQALHLLPKPTQKSHRCHQARASRLPLHLHAGTDAAPMQTKCLFIDNVKTPSVWAMPL